MSSGCVSTDAAPTMLVNPSVMACVSAMELSY
jgi:hypothetical protein